MNVSKMYLCLLGTLVLSQLHAADDFFGGYESQPIVGNVSLNDENPISIPTIISAPFYGNIQSAAGNGELGSDGSFTYVPDSGFSGVDTFVYQTGEDLFEVRLFSGPVQILSANNPDLALTTPAAANREQAILQERSTSLESSWSILGRQNEIKFETSLSTSRSFVIETWMPSAVGEEITLYTNNQRIWQDFALEKTPLGNHEIRSQYTNFTINRIAGVDLVAESGVSSSSDDWLISGVDQIAPPSAVDDRFIVEVDGTLDGNVLNNDTANSIDFASFLISGPQNGQFVGINQIIYGGLAPFGAFNYQPDPGFEGSDQFTYMSLGSANGTPSTLTTVTIRVGNSNNPVANDDFFNGSSDEVISERVLRNDVNSGGGFFDPQAVLVSEPRFGSFVGIYQSIYGGLAPFGDFEYQPNPGFNGVDSFAYKIINSGVESPVATVYLVVGEVKLAPLADWQLRLGTDGLANRTQFSLLDQNQNPDQNFQFMSVPQTDRIFLPYAGKALETWMPQAQGLDATLYTFNSQPWQQFKVQLSPSGTIILRSTYTGSVLEPENVTLGANIKTQIFTGDTAQQWLIAGPDQSYAPTGNDDDFQTPVGTLVEGNVLSNDEVNGFDFFSLPITQPNNGELVGIGGLIYDGIAPWGAFSYQPNPGFVGQDQFIYQVFSSGNGAPSRYVTVTINVTE